ncbi:carbonic anhydrase 12-like, partial [Haemaphysalis longicornis]
MHHWLTHERFIQNYRKCRLSDWSYGTVPFCKNFNTTHLLNSTEWSRRYPSCGGSQQSPIHLLFAHSTFHLFDPIQFFNYDSEMRLDVEMVGTTLFFYPFGLDVGVFGGPLEVPYSFFMGTIHFDRTSSAGSEHAIEKKRYAAEVQLVHSTEIMSENDCLREANGLLVLAVLLEEVAEDNPELATFLAALQELQVSGGTQSAPEFLLASLLPSSTLEYYVYPGSLPFPPCTERTINVVFATPLPIGRKQ